MGIQGLLPLLKEIQQTTHLREFKGKTLAVGARYYTTLCPYYGLFGLTCVGILRLPPDSYVLLHRGAYGCAQELATGQKTTR
jgi:exonuclease-1